MLKNFKRDYKTCIKDPNGTLRHFKIKINEMKYVNLAQRYIIIVFMDITKDVLKQKDIENSLSKILLTATDLKFKSDTNIIENGEITKMGDDIFQNATAINKLIGGK
jgi:hypothetical protein